MHNIHVRRKLETKLKIICERHSLFTICFQHSSKLTQGLLLGKLPNAGAHQEIFKGVVSIFQKPTSTQFWLVYFNRQ